MLAFIIIGLVTGSIYGLAGVGLVLTYRTTGILNFAHGAIGAAAAYLFYDLYMVRDVPWPLAAVIAIGIFGPAVGLVIERVTRGLGRAPVSTVIVATIGSADRDPGADCTSCSATASAASRRCCPRTSSPSTVSRSPTPR